jgi:hypothetical protein
VVDDSHICFWSEIQWWKWSVRWCMSWYNSQFFCRQCSGRGEVFAHFDAVAIKYHSSMLRPKLSMPFKHQCAAHASLPWTFV